MEQKQIKIKRRLIGNVLITLGCTAFTAAGTLFLYIGEGDAFMIIVGIVSIVFFGIGGLFYLLFMSWKPIVIISDEGITVPYGWGKNFTTWENVRKIEIVEQWVGGTRNRYLGVFVHNPEGIVGVGKRSQSISKGITDWNEVPDILITPTLSFVKIDKILGILQSFYYSRPIA